MTCELLNVVREAVGKEIAVGLCVSLRSPPYRIRQFVRSPIRDKMLS